MAMERFQLLQAFLGVSGLAISLYAIYIEQSKHSDNSYVAYCDVDETIACSDVLTSE